ncbi:hypothetical protein D1007_26122 [Hordeum vulgare]|nr:hypothetical protein D1007_26122 [Hordeum vulgare]
MNSPLDIQFKYVLTFYLYRAQAKKPKTGGSTLNADRPGMDEMDAPVRDILHENIGAYADPPKGDTTDNIPNAQVTPPRTDDVAMKSSHKEKLNPPSLVKSSKDATLEDDVVVIIGTGPRSTTLQDDSVLKLKAIYTLMEQLYAGGLLTIKAVWGGDKDPVKYIKDMLRQLSIIRQHIAEIRKSSARKGVMTAMSRAIAYAPELKPDEKAEGFPEYKDDDSEFTQEDYTLCVRDIRPAASRLAKILDLLKYQAAQDDGGKCV